MRTVIVSGGQIDDAFALKWIKSHKYERMIAADKGMEFFYRNGLIPDLIVGDFDSVSSESLNFFRGQKTQFIQLIPEKDDTDTESAIRRAIADGAKSITLLGATGSRLDHVLGNMHLLGIGLQKNVEMVMVDANNRIRMVNTPLTISKEEQFGKYISLVPFTPQVTGVTLEGFKYPLTDATLKCFNTLGISNEIVSEKAKLEFDEGILLVIESRD